MVWHLDVKPHDRALDRRKIGACPVPLFGYVSTYPSNHNLNGDIGEVAVVLPDILGVQVGSLARAITGVEPVDEKLPKIQVGLPPLGPNCRPTNGRDECVSNLLGLRPEPGESLAVEQQANVAAGVVGAGFAAPVAHAVADLDREAGFGLLPFGQVARHRNHPF